MKKWLKLLLVLALFKGIVFSLIIPIWQGPDEQAHFGQVAHFAELDRMPNDPNSNLTREIYESEILLGTLRDEKGNNKYTFHPEFRIDYVDSVYGKYEASISAYPVDFRKELTINEATFYPPLYYWLSAFFYWSVYWGNLITRVFITRFFGILLGCGTVMVAYFCGKELFPKDKVSQITLGLMVLMHPMLSFVFATINSDNLMNFLFSIGIYIGILINKYGLKKMYLLSAVLVLILGILTKPQFILIVPILLVATIMGLIKHKNDKANKRLSLVIISSCIIFFLLAILMKIIFNIAVLQTVDLLFVINKSGNLSFFQHLHNSIVQTYREALPWYWGVYDWLGVTYPRYIHRILNITLMLAIFGLGYRLITSILKRKSKIYTSPFAFMVFATLIYYFGIITFDFLYIKNTGGVSVGIQGRYFFPTIIAHMCLFLVGLQQLFSKILMKIYVSMIVGFGFIILNFVGIWTIASSYYSFNSYLDFFNQLSQYKPVIFKYPFSFVWIVCYLFSLSLFIYHYWKLKNA